MIRMQRPAIPKAATDGFLADVNVKILDYEEGEEGDITFVRDLLFKVRDKELQQTAILDYVVNMDDVLPNLNAPMLHYAVLFNCIEQVDCILQMGASANSVSGILRQKPLHWACGFDDSKVVSLLIKKGADFREYDVSIEGKAPIHIAAARGNVEVLRTLVKKGCHVDYPTMRYDLTPLFFAVKNRKKVAVAFLIGMGANVNARIKRLGWFTLVHLAVLGKDPESLRHLLRAGARLDYECSGKLKPLHVAAIVGTVECLSVLADYDLTMDVKINDGEFEQCPIIIAAEYGQLIFMKKLLQFGADPEARDRFGNTALHGAALYGKMEEMKYLLEEVFECDVESFDGKKPLHYAAAQSDPAIIEMLILFGADVKAEDKMGTTALHCAARYNRAKCAKKLLNCGAKISMNEAMNLELTVLYQAILGGSKQVLLSLKDYSLQITDTDKDGNSYLHYMAVCGYCKAIRFLLSLSADINAKNNKKYTPLHLAVIYDKMSAAEILIKNGADVNAETEDYMTAVHLAALKGNVKFLDILEKCCLNLVPKMSNRDGSLPIHVAAQRGQKNVISWYLKRGFDIDEPSEYGFTPLMYAVMSMDLDCIEFIIKEGADVNKPCSSFEDVTALYKACYYGNEEVVKLLISKGADVNAKNDYRLTPLHAAAHSGQENIYKILVEAGGDEYIVDCLGMTPQYLMERKGSPYSMEDFSE